MIIRGFRGDSNNHKIYFPSTSSNGIADTVSLLCLMGIVGAAILSDYLIVWRLNQYIVIFGLSIAVFMGFLLHICVWVGISTSHTISNYLTWIAL